MSFYPGAEFCSAPEGTLVGRASKGNTSGYWVPSPSRPQVVTELEKSAAEGPNAVAPLQGRHLYLAMCRPLDLAWAFGKDLELVDPPSSSRLPRGC